MLQRANLLLLFTEQLSDASHAMIIDDWVSQDAPCEVSSVTPVCAGHVYFSSVPLRVGAFINVFESSRPT